MVLLKSCLSIGVMLSCLLECSFFDDLLIIKRTRKLAGSFYLDMRMVSERIPRNADVIQRLLRPLLLLRQQQLQQPSCRRQPFQPSALLRDALPFLRMQQPWLPCEQP